MVYVNGILGGKNEPEICFRLLSEKNAFTIMLFVKTEHFTALQVRGKIRVFIITIMFHA